MHIYTTIKQVKNCLLDLKKEGKTIGFVPTMGALHTGHTTLLEKAKKENNITVSSIFVNPLQFNDKKDLEKYPKTLEKDIEKLKSAQCDVLFAPSVEEMYPAPHLNPPQRGGLGSASLSPLDNQAKGVGWERSSDGVGFDLGHLDKIMEGAHRPGHFQGVCVVVKKLFDIIEPNKAYFGEKDFQQLMVIKHMVKSLALPVEIIACPTVRESDGLAMSSRNALLNPDERKNAPLLFRTLTEGKAKSKSMPVTELSKWVERQINENPFLKLEYFELVDATTLLPVSSREASKNIQACIAVKAGSVRLIDNVRM